MVHIGWIFKRRYKELEGFSDALEFRDAKEKSCGRERRNSSSGAVDRTESQDCKTAGNCNMRG